MKKHLITFSAGLAFIIVLLNWVEYNFILKSLNLEVYISIVAAVFLALGIWAGAKYFTSTKSASSKPEISQKQIKDLGLSRREIDVLLAMSNGLSNQEIAEKLFLSESTIKTHSSKLYAKLGVNRRTQAILKAKELGIVG